MYVGLKDVDLLSGKLYHQNVQPQAQLCNVYIRTCLKHIYTLLMLTSNTVSNHKSYCDMLKICMYIRAA